MSDFSDPTKSQENKPPRKEEAVNPELEQQATDEGQPQDILSEEPPASADDSSEKVTEASSSEQHTEPEETVAESEKTDEEEDASPASQEEGNEVTTSDTATTDSSEAQPASDEQPSVENEPASYAASELHVEKDDDTQDTDDDLIVAAAASKVSSRFGKKRPETAQPEPEKTEPPAPEPDKPQHGTVSAEVPPKSKASKKKKEKKPKEPLPEVAPESTLLNTLSLLPCLTLVIFAALQGGIALFFRDLWPLQETQTAAVVQDTLAATNWLTPVLDGKPYSGAMPLYFWFSSAVALIPDITLTFAVKAATVISSILFVLATYLLARAAGVSKKTSLTGGLLTMAAFLPALTMQLNGMETLFAALVTFSHAAFVMGWKKHRSFFWMTLGFISAAAATLTGGFPGLFLPLFSLIITSCWRKRPTRFGEWDVAGGFGIYLVMVLSWFAYVYFAVQPEYLLNLVPNVLAAPFKGALAHLPYWWHMLAMLPFILLPWLIVILVLPWTRLFGLSFYKNVLATRTPEHIGIAYLWISAVLTCAAYCVLDYMTPVWLLVLLPQLAILAARAIATFSPLRSTVFYKLLAVLFLAAGAGLIVLVNFTELIPFAVEGWMYLAAILLAAAGIFWIRSPWNSRLGVAGLALVMTLLMQPLLIMSAPAINSFFSVEEISQSLHEYAEKDFVPVIYNADPAPFAYFVDKPVTHIFGMHALTTLLNANNDVAIIMSATDWDNWLTKPETLTQVGTQQPAIAHLGKGFVIAIQEKSAGNYRTPQQQDSDTDFPQTQEDPSTAPTDEMKPAVPSDTPPEIDLPQTDNEEDPAPFNQPVHDNSTTADASSEQENVVATQAEPTQTAVQPEPEQTAPEN